MNPEDIVVANTVQYVKKKLHGECSGHDWWHIYRVWKMALYIAIREGADRYIVQLAALLHDVEDWKFIDKKEQIGQGEIYEWLVSQKLNAKTIKRICEITQSVSYKGAEVNTTMRTLEGKVVQDADRLDAIGAIGIARAFAFGGANNREMHNPDIHPVMHKSFEEYKKNQSTSINHFYEKLLLLKDRMNTETAKHLANERHRFMEFYLRQFFAEWHGER